MDSSTMELSIVPPGFRFHPTDEELVGYYLKKKVASQKIDLDVIRDIDLYRIEPWDLQEKCKMGKEEQKEWYFFSHKDKKYPTGTRTNRATLAGFWKATGRDKEIYDKGKLIGMRKTLVFYKGRAPHGLKSDWIMHEYRLESDSNRGIPQEEGWVVCRAFKKKTTMQSKNIEGRPDSTILYDETNGLSSIIDPILVTRQPQNTNFFPNNLICQQEIESKALTRFIMNSSSVDNFLDLPQLDSPSQLPFLRRPCTSSSISLLVSNNNDNNNNNNDDNKENVTDWRTLDKFVASQLSQDPKQVSNHHDYNRGILSFIDDDHEEFRNSDMEAFLLLHESEDREDEIMIEGSKFISGLLSSSSGNGDNIGVCIFD